MDNYAFYFPDRRQDFRKQCRATACGHTLIPPAAPYPLLSSHHPKDHALSWQVGRILCSFQFIYISSGSGTFESRTAGLLKVVAPCLLMLFPGEWHRYKPMSESGWTEDWMEFDGTLFHDPVIIKNVTPKRPLSTLHEPYEVWSIFDRVHQLAAKRPSMYLEELGLLAMQLLIIHHRIVSGDQRLNPFAGSIVQRAQTQMQARIGGPFHVAKFAAESNVSESYFRKSFHRQTGLSPRQYWMRLRMRQAENWLQNTVKPITEIADELGFDSIFHFSAWFKRYTGMPPSEWRRRHRLI